MLTFYEILRSDNKTRAYIVSEFSEMGDLFEMTKQMTNTGEKVWVPLSELKARHLIRGIAEGLKHLHSIGIAHGDLKPDNILIFRNMLQNETTLRGRERFDRFLPKITDFSNSRIRESTDPENQILCRTPTCTIYYAAPESDMGLEYDMIRADLFSVGCCLLAMLLAAYPFKPHIDWPNSFWPNFQQKSIQCKSLSNEMKKDSAYSYGLCKVFNPKLRQVLLKLIDPNPESRLTLNQFLADQWFTRN
jgi:serine/threonine protein kinase